MKRGLALLLSGCLLLLLCACGKAPAQQPAGTDASAAAQTQPAGKAETPAEPAVFSLKTLPDIGTYYTGEKKAYFFEDGAHDDFVPGDDYGPILPYIAEVVPFREVPYYTYSYDDQEVTEKVENRTLSYESRYGVMTRDGRIITGPLFDYCWCYTDRRGTNVWNFGVIEGEDEMSFRQVVLGGDGSWRLDFPAQKHIMFETEDAEGYFSVGDYTDDSQPYSYYSFDGARMTELEKTIRALEQNGWNAYPFSIGEDEFVFKLWKQNDEASAEADVTDDTGDVEDSGTRYVFTDRQGNKRKELRLPYDLREMWGDLLLCYDSDWDELLVYDRQGDLRLPAVTGDYRLDRAAQLLLVHDEDDGLVRVFDQACNPVASYPMDWDTLETAPNGSVFADTQHRCAYAVADGKQIDFGRADILTLETVNETLPEETGDLFFLLETQDGGFYLHNLDGSPVASVHAPDADVWKDAFDRDRTSYTLSITDQYILSASEKDGWYLYDRRTGAERHLSIPRTDLIRDEDEDAYNDYRIYGRYLKITHSFFSDERGSRTREELYDLAADRLLCPDLVWFDSFPDASVVIVKNAAYVLANNGAVILKLCNDNII